MGESRDLTHPLPLPRGELFCGGWMVIRTHIAFSWVILFGIIAVFGVAVNAYTIIAITLGAILPDIDTRASTIGKIFSFISKKIEKKYGHRTITHSWITLFISAVILVPTAYVLDVYLIGFDQVSNIQIVTSFIIGWFTHILLDTMTIQGVKVMFPVSQRRGVFPFDPSFPYSFRTNTGSKIDKILFVIFITGALVAFPIGTVGYQRIIRSLQQDIMSAVNDYNEMARNNLVKVKTEATNQISRKDISGDFNVYGSLSYETLLIEKDGEMYTLGNKYSDHLYAQKVKCFRDEKIDLSIKEIELSNESIRELKNYKNENDLRVLFFGEVIIEENEQSKYIQHLDRFNTITIESNKLKMKYARIRDLEKYGVENAFIESGTIKVYSYSRPGEIKYSNTDKIKVEGVRGKSLTIVTEIEDLNNLFVTSGDTVKTGQRLFIKDKNVSGEMNDIQEIEIEINIIKIKMETELETYEKEIMFAVSDTLKTSKTYTRTKRKYEKGFATKGHLEKQREKFEVSKNIYFNIVNKKLIAKKNYELKLLNLKNKKIRKEKEIESNYVLSKSKGIIEDINIRINKNNKYSVKIIIRLGEKNEYKNRKILHQDMGDLTYSYNVLSVRDGDTFNIIYDGVKTGVRMIGIDTPESNKTRYGYVEEMGREAKEKKKKLLNGKKVRLEFDVQKRDKYRRLLAYVFLEDGTFLNAHLLEKGYARLATYPPNVKYLDFFRTISHLEGQAKAKIKEPR